MNRKQSVLPGVMPDSLASSSSSFPLLQVNLPIIISINIKMMMDHCNVILQKMCLRHAPTALSAPPARKNISSMISFHGFLGSIQKDNPFTMVYYVAIFIFKSKRDFKFTSESHIVIVI